MIKKYFRLTNIFYLYENNYNISKYIILFVKYV
jgi:hypothetical protein